MTVRRPVLPVIEEVEPISVINTTPLIDLMLVLLIMFILSVPVATHKLPLDLPTTGGGPQPAFHRLSLDAAGRFYWNGQAIADSELRPRLAAVAADPAEPELQIAADAETRYERVDQTLAVVRRAGITRLGFVGNERFAASLDR